MQRKLHNEDARCTSVGRELHNLGDATENVLLSGHLLYTPELPRVEELSRDPLLLTLTHKLCKKEQLKPGG